MLKNVNVRIVSSKNDTNFNYTCYSDAQAIDPNGNNSPTPIVYCSIVTTPGIGKEIISAYNDRQKKKYSITFSGDNFYGTISRQTHDLRIFKTNNVYHLVLQQKKINSIDENSTSNYTNVHVSQYIVADKNQTGMALNDEQKKAFSAYIYDGIISNTSIPMIQEWNEYIMGKLIENKSVSIVPLKKNCDEIDINYGFTHVLIASFYSWQIKDWLTSGLRAKEISIDGCNTMSEDLHRVQGLDSYMSLYGQTLSDKVTKTFKPKFDPREEKHDSKIDDLYDVASYYSPRIRKYKTQKNVVEALTRHLKTHKHALLSAEPGAGKTLMSIETVTNAARYKNFSVLVMCPVTLTETWKQEILGVSPMADVAVVKSLPEFIEATKDLKNIKRSRSLWVIISDGTAKSDYETRPAVVWSKRKNCFVCPKCNKPIEVTRTRNRFGERIARWGNQNFSFDDFDVLEMNNAFCKNKIKSSDGETDDKICGEKLYTAATKNNSKDWVKLPKVGWILKSRISTVKKLCEGYVTNINEEAPARMLAKYKAILKAIDDYQTSGSVDRFPNRYSLARYVKKYLRGAFDFGIFDEVHELTGDTLQGHAFGCLVNAVKKTISLTGTLSNGYAGGLFQLLFRTNTHRMLEMGYEYDSRAAFENEFGVKEQTTVEDGYFLGGHEIEDFHRRKSNTKSKILPGVSPVLTTTFLMDSSIFIRQKDIKTKLCDYKEIPMAIKADDELQKAYNSLLNANLREITQTRDRRQLRNVITKLSMFLDQPYGLEVVDEVSEDGVPHYLELSDKTVRAKEQALIDLAKQKKAAGEKMLIYCEWTGRLDIMNRLQKLLEDNEIRATTMDDTVKKAERQQWLNDKAENDEIDAIILNPRLVEVGLNLLKYTTIIFYEVGTKLFTIRQASQRSRRINQDHSVEVYFMYYKDTIQQQTLGIISQKLKASVAIEGNFSESGLAQISDDTDILTAIANSFVKNENIVIDNNNFENSATADTQTIIKAEDDEEVSSGIHFKKNNFSFMNSSSVIPYNIFAIA